MGGSICCGEDMMESNFANAHKQIHTTNIASIEPEGSRNSGMVIRSAHGPVQVMYPNADNAIPVLRITQSEPGQTIGQNNRQLQQMSRPQLFSQPPQITIEGQRTAHVAVDVPIEPSNSQQLGSIRPAGVIEPPSISLSPTQQFVEELRGMNVPEERINWMLRSTTSEEERRIVQQLNNQAGQQPKSAEIAKDAVRRIEIEAPKTDAKDTCMICTDEFCKKGPDSSFLECMHWFHASCLNQWIDTKGISVCPECRRGSSVVYIVKN
jgi:Ring finger domain